MDSKNLQVRISAIAKPQEAMQAISNIAGWWATNVKGRSKELGDNFTVRFGKTFSDFKIIEFIPDKKVVWLVTDSDLPLFRNRTEWKNTKITWDILSKNGEVEITMTHFGLTPACDCYNDCQKGWSFYVKESLLKLLTDGPGFPGTGITSYIFSGDRKYEGLLYFKNDPLPEYSDGFFFIDVKETNGEEVTVAYSVSEYRKEKFNAAMLQGEYFMILENKPMFGDLVPMDDISGKINQTS